MQNINSNTLLTPYQIIRQSRINDLINLTTTLLYDNNPRLYSSCGPLGQFKYQNCVNTAHAVSLIFLGIETTKKITEDSSHCIVNLNVLLPSGKTWAFSVKALFDGSISHDISTDCQYKESDKSQRKVIANQYREYYIKKFMETIQPLIDDSKKETDEETISTLKEKFSYLKFPFNKVSVELLQNDIFERNDKTTKNSSFIYVLEIVTSSKNPPTTEHKCILEQFFNEETKEVSFRLYQSWIGQATLMDDLTKQGEIPWSLEKLKEFLLSLETYCCSFEKTTLSFFGYSDSLFPLLHFDGKSFLGKVLKYQIFEINPEKCLSNYSTLFK